MAEAVPLIAAPLAPLVIGGGIKALDYVMKARKQGEGRRSQPVDYGQGGTATPRGKSVQRGRLNSNDAYIRAKREERKKEAQRRARERAEQGIDELIGSEADRKYAKQKRQERGIEEGMLPVPSMARRLMNNPPIQQQDKEDKFKKQYDKKFKGYDKKIRDLRKELKASNKHRDEKLNYQYKDVTNPKRPSDPVKDLKKKGTA